MEQKKKVIDAETQKNIDSWLQGPYDEHAKEEIRRLQRDDPEELIDAFFKTLDFGTGGLRGVMGIGTNRMNEYTVASATQGLANYLLAKYPKKKLSVLIGYDTRKHSRKFAIVAASVLAGNNIDALVFNEFRPIALISFGTLFSRADAGIKITASHNPPKYNGYKVYGKNGGQVVHPDDELIIAEVNKITSPELVKRVSYPHSKIKDVGPLIDEAYLKEIHKLQHYPQNNVANGKNLSIVYTSLHGGGIFLVPSALKSWGFTNLHIVKEQATSDGNFPTVKSPNPEEKETLTMGIEMLEKVRGDILLATDPDCDRIAVVVTHKLKPFIFNGNEMAALLLEHILRSLKKQNVMPPKPVAIKTIVTTPLFKAIGDHYKTTVLDVLTGFKYIGEKIAHEEEEKERKVPYHHFLFGAEESYGYLAGTHARDKDAVVTAALIAEMALQLKLEGKTLVDFLYEIYHTYGVFREKLLNLTFEGKAGIEKMQALMTSLRKHPPMTIEAASVEVVEDYLTRTRHYLKTNTTEPLTLPKSDVLRYFLSDETQIVIRPSGTEPKTKIYVSSLVKHIYKNDAELEAGITVCDQKADLYLSSMKKLSSL